MQISIVSGCMSLFNASIAQHVSAYLAIIMCTKILGKIDTILHAVITHVAMFS
jgi:hypothetical protein